MNTDEFTTQDEMITEIIETKPRKRLICCSPVKGNMCNICAYGVFAIAIAILYILHFTASKPQTFVPREITGTPGSGEIVFVNLDTINENYELVAILTGDIKAEMAKQDAIFANKENAFQRKYKQFQENMNAGILTQVQTENAQKQLMQEYEQLEADKERIFGNLQERQAAALVQIYDSLKSTLQRINIERNASFIVSYQEQNPFLLVTDPAKDITQQVLFELNRTYKKK